MNVQLDRIANNGQGLSVFKVFTADTADGITYKGNPATVVIVDSLPTLKDHLALLQRLNNSDTKKQVIPEFMTLVYISPLNLGLNLNDKLNSNPNEFAIRWFSSTSVIKRCGHGTLAAAAFLVEHRKNDLLSTPYPSLLTLRFHSDSESLNVRVIQQKDNLKINSNSFALQLEQESLVTSHKMLHLGANLNILRENKTNNDDGYLIIELSSAREVAEFTLTTSIIDAIAERALIVTAVAKNKHFDVAFRYFAPFYGQLEDSATGSAASVLSPFWEALSQAGQLRCYQASQNGGFFIIERNNNNNHLGSASNTIAVIGHVTSTALKDYTQ
jgi:predicted PhzF superfamily epimerase YddE/YHI9